MDLPRPTVPKIHLDNGQSRLDNALLQPHHVAFEKTAQQEAAFALERSRVVVHVVHQDILVDVGTQHIPALGIHRLKRSAIALRKCQFDI